MKFLAIALLLCGCVSRPIVIDVTDQSAVCSMEGGILVEVETKGGELVAYSCQPIPMPSSEHERGRST